MSAYRLGMTLSDTRIERCAKCGTELLERSHHVCEDEEIPYCTRCVTPHGLLESIDQVEAQLTTFYRESLGLSEDEAKRKTQEKIDLLKG